MTKEQKYMKEELSEATYVGEDGGMVVDAKFTRHGAWRKMILRLREDCGDTEAEEFIESVKPTDLGIAYLHFLTEREKKEYEEGTEWYVSLKKKSPYEVWAWWG